MEEKLVKILNEMAEYLSISQMKKLQEVLLKNMKEQEDSISETTNYDYLEMFIAAKKIEGCSDRTVAYYKVTVEHLLKCIDTPIRKITTDEIRSYLAKYQEKGGCSKTTVDNIRRNISSFFSWLEEEDYILKSPMKRIHKIKTVQPVKETISDELIERLRDACLCKRDLAMVDLLYSTGIRVGELVRLKELIEKGLKIEGGDKLGKTIIFAKNSLHAQAIVERFNKLFPEYGGDFIKQIDYSIKYCDSLIDEFSSKDKMPQIAVSVDMLDTGIDIPEILNLVFFKKVRSYAKFWQMIGRGTRLCPYLLGEGLDKERFLIFDFCNNFEYFRVNTNGTENGIAESLSEKIYNTKAQIVRELQAPRYTSDASYGEYRADLVDDLHGAVIELNDDSFLVKRHLRYVEIFRALSAWDSLETIEISDIKEHIAPLIKPKKEDELARRFDYLVYSIDLGLLQSKSVQNLVNIVVQTAEQLSTKYSIPQVEKQKNIIEKVQTTEFWDSVTIIELETVRNAMRSLLQYLDKIRRKIYYTNFTDTIIDSVEGEPIYGGNDFQNYRKKVEFYLKEHSNRISVYKLRNNKQLTEVDLKELERILWTELGSKEDYIKEYGDTPVGRLVRQIVGVDRAAVNEAFSKFLTEERLNINQMRFVNLIVDYIVANGNIDDNKVLMGEPFKSVGSITSLFKDNMGTAKQIMEVIAQIKRNSEEIA